MAESIKSPSDILALPLHVRAEMAIKAASIKLVKERLADGSPLYIWRDGQVVAVPPEEFQYLLSDTPTE